jgi:hypothetical protein
LLIVGASIAAAFVATCRMERACAMRLAFQQSGAAFYPIAEEVVAAACSRPTGGRNEPAQFEWPALLRSSTGSTRPTSVSRGTAAAFRSPQPTGEDGTLWSYAWPHREQPEGGKWKPIASSTRQR